MTLTDMPEKIHQGKNVKRFREMLNMKQEALAIELGEDWTQRKVSLLEQKETIESEILDQVAKALKVPPEAIKNFNEEAAYNVIGNTVTHNDNVAFFQYHPVINPIERWVEALEENKKLYERLLQAERDKVELLEKLLKEKK